MFLHVLNFEHFENLYHFMSLFGSKVHKIHCSFPLPSFDHALYISTYSILLLPSHYGGFSTGYHSLVKWSTKYAWWQIRLTEICIISCHYLGPRYIKSIVHFHSPHLITRCIFPHTLFCCCQATMVVSLLGTTALWSGARNMHDGEYV